MSEPLTKKQRKVLAFRERKGRKKAEPESLEVPETELLLDHEIKLYAKDPDPAPVFSTTKKRKRDDDPPSKSEKKSKTAIDSIVPESSTSNEAQNSRKEGKKKRLILFLGNLSYKTSETAILKHFSACPTPPSIRLLTPKGSSGNAAPPTRSKGCAFLEFTDGKSLQYALTLHHSTLDGRTINVELSAGGGGTSDKRRNALRAKNKALNVKREQVQARWAAKKTRGAARKLAPTEEKGVTRHSGTSGLDPQAALPDKTWSIPQGDEQGGRGGKKHTRKRGSKTKSSWTPSGANAVSVG